MILPEDTKIAIPDDRDDGPSNVERGPSPAGYTTSPTSPDTPTNGFPSTGFTRSAWSTDADGTTQDPWAGAASSNGRIRPVSSFTRLTQQYGTTRLDAVDSDNEEGWDAEEGVGEELPPYTRRGTRASRAPRSVMVDDEDDDEELVIGAGRPGWRKFLGMDGTKAGRKRREILIRGGIIATVLYFCAFLAIRSLSNGGGPHHRDRRIGSSPFPIPTESDGTVLYCTDIEQEDTFSYDSTHRALNSTFYLPVDSALSFVHINGPYSVGEVVMTSYVPGDDDMEIAKESLDVDSVWPMKVVVEAIYRPEAASGNEGEDGDGEEGLQGEPTEVNGWEELQHSSLCVMKRTLNDTEVDGDMDEDGDRQQPPPPQKRSVAATVATATKLWGLFGSSKDPGRTGMGVGIYTRTAQNDTVFHNSTSTISIPLHFKIYLYIPVSPSSSVQTIPAVDLSAILMDYHVHDVEDQTVFGAVRLHNSLGNMRVDSLTTHVFKAHTAGTITVTANISRQLDIFCPQGEIDATVSLTKPAHQSIDPSDDGSRAPPHSIKTVLGSGNNKLKVVGWEQPNRNADLECSAQIGAVEVQQHAAYQGSFEMRTPLGNLDFVQLDDENLADPLGQGRERQVNITRSEALGDKRVSGDVAWIAPGSPAVKPLPDGPTGSTMKLTSSLGSVKLTL